VVIAARTRLGQAGVGLAVAVADGLGDGLGVAEEAPHVDVIAITNRRMATRRPQ
jgi:hypothetical protein